MKLSLVVGCLLAVFGLSIANARHFEPDPIVVRASAAALLVAVEDVECQQCESTRLGEPQGGVGGGEVSWRSEQELRTLLRTSQFEAARDLIDGNDRLALDASRDRVIILGCGDEVFSVVRLDRSAIDALVSEL